MNALEIPTYQQVAAKINKLMNYDPENKAQVREKMPFI